ncbi:hypothetical protein RRG08_032088 [Elysia crispata]|uniref:Uncharacterized protein n=1 Tax=Elysia crispata TaxID=231223 RepID=A0AAE0ZER4_9GAST|nr:hypothetical protein RRG08_032088 [Elysia crispata]
MKEYLMQGERRYVMNTGPKPSQNKNSFIAALLAHTVESSNTELKAISHTFLEPGHTYMEVDSMHSATEAEKSLSQYTL